MKNLTLSKNSGPAEIEAYFRKLLELKESGEMFPVDLDMVWPLAYSRKDYATKELKFNFIKEVDYQTFRQKAERGIGVAISHKYKLSLTCLEFFVARKIRPVFEVYRKVFHQALELHRQLNWHGCPTIYFNGRVLVNYRASLKACELSLTSGSANKRRNNNSGEFEKLFNQNFVTVLFAGKMYRESKVRQLELGFTQKQKAI